MEITLIQILAITVPAILGFLLSHLLDRFRSSTIHLQKRVSIQTIARSYKDDFWGNIDISHNNERIDHLHMVAIELFNFSKKDVDNLNIQVAFGEGNKIVSSRSMNMDTRVELANTEAFETLIEQENWEFISSNREYECKVLNRTTNLRFELLIDSKDEELDEDEVIIAIEKKGVKVIPYKNINDEYSGQWAIYIGIAFTLLIAFGTYKIFPESGTPILIVGLAGALNLIIGLVTFYTLVGWRHWNDDNEE